MLEEVEEMIGELPSAYGFVYAKGLAQTLSTLEFLAKQAGLPLLARALVGPRAFAELLSMEVLELQARDWTFLSESLNVLWGMLSKLHREGENASLHREAAEAEELLHRYQPLIGGLAARIRSA